MMISSFFRNRKPLTSDEADSSTIPYAEQRHATADWTEDDDDDEATEEEDDGEQGDMGPHRDIHDAEDDMEGDEEDEEEDGAEDAPLLPIFSAAHLDALPVYNATHAIRLIVLPRTETTLTWDQLRSPQVSQFLVKPMQQQIRNAHFSRATLYALMANCLQFQKESQLNPGNAGTSRTRALVCELLAIKLLKEYTTRELIDALSYDFFPLQGAADSTVTQSRGWEQRNRPAAARISTLEVAIRASAKRFLAHPLVVQQLEAIWAGTIVFHFQADGLHRIQSQPSASGPQERNTRSPLLQASGHTSQYGATMTTTQHKQQLPSTRGRRAVTLYDPRDASLFKLSRLRVPRYRQFFSTCSLAILLALFVAVLSERSTDITTLEVLFWFWSAGFMLDEVVGFNEQGFSLYIMSFWNAFDLGILFLLMVYYAMRLYGIFLVSSGRHQWNSMAYDVLATNAILLFPRLFSVLDHVKYFSQLLIAFRLMAIDLVAVFILILIACSGFFVAFTFSFGENQYDAAEVAYKIFQILMGFTPAAWEAWPTYNPLGKALLVLFLFICHFLVVTILITVLTNSFMAIVSNAEQEHQFVFAVNTISMVKNDDLFSYVAPSNIVAWLLTPLRYIVPFRVFIKLNRTVIKLTHFPLLFGIYIYETIFLATDVFEPTDLVENRGRRRTISLHDPKSALLSPAVRMRQESVAGFQKDMALEEVFRLKPRPDTLRNTRKGSGRGAHEMVNNWMELQGKVQSPLGDPDRTPVDRTQRKSSRRGFGTRSIASDPGLLANDEAVEDGDDELNPHDEEERGTFEHGTAESQSHATSTEKEDESEGYFNTPSAIKPKENRLPVQTPTEKSGPAITGATNRPVRQRSHIRNASASTVVYNPSLNEKIMPSISHAMAATNVGNSTSARGGTRTPRNSIYSKSHPRPIMPPRAATQAAPTFNIDSQMSRTRQMRHRRSSLDLGVSEWGHDNNASGVGGIPNSFNTQLALATGGLKAMGRAKDKDDDTDGMMGRLMLARMKTLEEGFAEVVKEFRGLRTAGNSSVETESKGKGRPRERKRRGIPMLRTTSEVDFAMDDWNTQTKVGTMEENKDTPQRAMIHRHASQGSSL